MNKRQFQEAINRAERELREPISLPDNDAYLGVCEVLDVLFWILKAKTDFQRNFSPKINSTGYWLGDDSGQEGKENIEKRVTYLRMFEQWAITYKTYRSY